MSTQVWIAPVGTPIDGDGWVEMGVISDDGISPRIQKEVRKALTYELPKNDPPPWAGNIAKQRRKRKM